MDLSVKSYRLQAVQMSQFSNPSGHRMACCTMSPIELAGGISTAGAMDISSRSIKSRRSLEGRSGCSGCPLMHLNQPIASFAPYNVRGIWHLGILNTTTGELERIETPYSEISFLRCGSGCAVFYAGSPTAPVSVVRLDLATRRMAVLRHSSNVVIDIRYLSVPQAIEFPTEHGLTAHAFFYPPQNRDYTPPFSERPPLIVVSHGGPTGATSTAFDLEIQYLTSRGIAVLDVNYGGSTGYGRAYRQRLNGQWGTVDVDDCVNGVRYLVGTRRG